MLKCLKIRLYFLGITFFQEGVIMAQYISNPFQFSNQHQMGVLLFQREYYILENKAKNTGEFFQSGNNYSLLRRSKTFFLQPKSQNSLQILNSYFTIYVALNAWCQLKGQICSKKFVAKSCRFVYAPMTFQWTLDIKGLSNNVLPLSLIIIFFQIYMGRF